MAIVVAGMDGFKARWVCIVLRDGAFDAARMFPSLREGVESLPDAVIIAVDTPIGFPAGCGRRAEHEAKTLVGPRRSSVFLTLPRFVYEVETYVESFSLARKLTGQGLSRQSFALRQKIFEAEEVSRMDTRVIEVHPEVSFRELAGGPLAYSKTSWAGLLLRRQLLAAAGIEIPDDLAAGSSSASAKTDPGNAGPDDVLDAAVAAWTAHRKATGTSRCLPAAAVADPSEGVIWY